MEKYCAECGQELKEGSRFCPRCGKEIKQEKTLIERARENDVQTWEEIYKSTYAKAYVYYDGAKARVYFFIGNAYMDDKPDALYE